MDAKRILNTICTACPGLRVAIPLGLWKYAMSTRVKTGHDATVYPAALKHSLPTPWVTPYMKPTSVIVNGVGFGFDTTPVNVNTTPPVVGSDATVMKASPSPTKLARETGENGLVEAGVPEPH